MVVYNLVIYTCVYVCVCVFWTALAFFEHINFVYGCLSEFCQFPTCPAMTGPGSTCVQYTLHTGYQTILRCERSPPRAFVFTRTPPVEAHRPVVTYLQFPIQVCFPCNDHAQPAADKAPTSVTDNLVVLIVV